MLTRQQHRLLTYIRQCLRENGVPPSFDEMKKEMGLKSKSGIHRLILSLEERGFINRLPNRARALEVVKLPDNIAGKTSEKIHALAPENHKKKTSQSRQTVTIPFLGKITTQTPIESLQNEMKRIDIPAYLVGIGEHFALEMEGDSMIEAGIFSQDTVIVRRCTMAETGTIIVALVDQTEVTIKRLRQRGNSIALEAANQNYETRIFGPDRVHIQGKLVGLIRHYE